MSNEPQQVISVSLEAQAHAQRIIDTAATIRMPELFASSKVEPIYFLPNRNGVATIVLRTSDLTPDQLFRGRCRVGRDRPRGRAGGSRQLLRNGDIRLLQGR